MKDLELICADLTEKLRAVQLTLDDAEVRKIA